MLGRSLQQSATRASSSRRWAAIVARSRYHETVVTTTTTTTTTRRRSVSSSSSLSHEWIVDGRLLPSDGKTDDAVRDELGDREVVVFLHGLLGNAKNLRTPAKKLTERLPHLAALSLDLRGHGRNHPSAEFLPPHDFESCARDVRDALRSSGCVGPVAICGHSLGGRIALRYSYDLARRSSTSEGDVRLPKQTWILDSVPGRAHPSVREVMDAASSVSIPVTSKSHLVETLMDRHGLEKGVAMWMASNLRPIDGGFDWTFDLSVAEELISNFANQEYRSMIEGVVARPDAEVHLVMAGKNAEWTEDIVQDLRRIPSATSEGGKFQMHTLEKAGHWVHVDDLEGLLELMVEALRRR
ncbi:hypothetical protein ACHAW6_013900 [Cyclotella cf. meneghiniana]